MRLRNPGGECALKRLALFGVTGRMGQAVVQALADSHDLTLSGALAARGHERIGQPVAPSAGGAVSIVDEPRAALDCADVALDFSRAEAVEAHLAACLDAGVPIVVAVTGLSAGTQRSLVEAARTIPVLPAANTSLGIAVMNRLAATAAACLPRFEVEIAEAHHRMKRDAPSGTALQLGESVARSRGQQLADVTLAARQGFTGPRPPEGVGFSVIRAGDIVGTHTVLLAGSDETLEITHRATDRACFARGAIAAAAWLAGREPGLYRMEDVLGI